MSEIKPSYDDNRTILADTVPLVQPLAIQITPSEVCNFRCGYCIKSKHKIGPMMDWDTFFMICDQLQDFTSPIKQITIAGWGEPLMNKDLPLMIAFMKKMKVAERISLVTNGSLLSPFVSGLLVGARVDAIKISVQALNAEGYKKVSGVSLDFRKFVSNISYLYKNKRGCEVYVKTVGGDEEKFYSIFKNISDRMYVEKICPIFEEGENEENKFRQPHPPVLVCPHPFYNLNITASGDILPCCSYYDPLYLGNVRETTIRKAWESEEMNKFLVMMLKKLRNRQILYDACNGCKIPDVITLQQDDLDSRAEEVLERWPKRRFFL